MRRPPALLFVVVLSAALAALSLSCGKATDPSSTVVLKIASTDSLDGWVQSDGALTVNGAGPLTGDLTAFPGVGFREFYSFDLSGVPASATITSATLRLYQEQVGGTPYAKLGNVVVDHVNFGTVLHGTDYAAPALAASVGIISSDTTKGYKSLNVLSRVLADRAAARTRSQFRIRFSIQDTDGDGVSDYALFTDAEMSCCVAATTQPPRLVIAYHL
jgi:hypothetical protein